MPIAPADLREHACLGYVNWSGRPYDDWRFTKNGHVYAVRVHSRFQVNDGRVLVNAAIEGHGIILQPEAALRTALTEGHLVPVLTDYEAPSRPMYLMFTPRRPQPPKLRTLIDCVMAAFGKR